MAWQGIEAHDEVVESFRRALARGRLASTFLFVGPPGVGKRTFALKLSQALLCPSSRDAALDPCGQCESCVRMVAGTHPDVHIVERPTDKSDIPLALLVGEDERRGREGLCHDMALKPFMGGRRIAIIDDADHLNEAGANALLKTLEEPPPGTIFLLIGTSADRQLPTIRSRAQLVRFSPLPLDVTARLIVQLGLAGEATEAERLAKLSGGSLTRAAELADAEVWAFRPKLYAALGQVVLPSVELARTVLALVDAAGKEAPPRRRRLRQIVTLAAEFYRQRMRDSAGAEQELAADCIERCLEALEHIDRNANQASLTECWLDDLARLAAAAPAAA